MDLFILNPVVVVALWLLSMCNYVHYTTTTIWNHKHNKNNNNCKLTEIGAFSEVINVWLTCPVAQHQMTACKAGHNVKHKVKLLWRWQFWMGSHFRHCLANSWSAVTDSFSWRVYLKGYLGTSSHILYLSLHLTSTWGVYLKGYLGTSSHILYLSLHLTSTWGSIWKVILVLHLTSYICHFIWQVHGGSIWKVILVLHLTSYICHFIWQVPRGSIWEDIIWKFEFPYV